MNAPKRKRARILTASGLKKLREQMRSHEVEENAGFKYTLERLGELTGLDPETVKNVLDCQGSDKRTIARCFETFGLTLTASDHIPVAQAATTADPNFVGRDEAIADLDTLVSRSARVIVIQARGGVGKTTLARKYLQQEFGSFLEFPIAKETKDIASIEGLLEEKLRQLGEEPGRELLVSLDRLKRKLQAERIGILIDNLEPALDSAGKFIEAHRRYVELLRVLSDPTVLSLTLITSRERLREADVTVQHYPLRSLSVQAWSQFFQSRSISIETPALATLHDAYGGNAKAMDIISGAVLEDFSGDVEAYWQANQDDLFIERDLEDLVTKQFDRLQELDPDAYKLLCRMGCYRYQDVPTVPIEGLFCLLWDVPENRHRRVIKTLQDRSIVDFEKDEFWLHPVIREEAIARLRRSDSWEAANLKSANFWEASVQSIENINDAIRAFETCFHHLTIRNFDRAGYFFLSKRKDKSVGYNLIELGRSFNRLGLFRPMIEPISTVIENTTSSYLTSRLYGLLSLPYRIVGKPLKAIEYNYQSIKLAEDYLESLIQKGDEDLLEFKFLKLNSLLQIGLCQLDLWELEKAHDIFCESSKIEQEIKVNCSSSEAIKYNFGKYGANCFLVFTKTCLQPDRRELAIINEIYQGMKLNSKIGTGYRLIFLGAAYKNLGEFNRALEIYQEVVNHSEKFQYLGPDAIALRHIGEVYMRKKNFSLAISSHIRAIDLFSKTGAFGDLAKTYYQLGLTYRENGEVEKSHESFQEAIRLFGEMEAPKQVERVRQSMQN